MAQYTLTSTLFTLLTHAGYRARAQTVTMSPNFRDLTKAPLPVALPRPAASSWSASGDSGSTSSVALHSTWWCSKLREANLLRWIRWSGAGCSVWRYCAPVAAGGGALGLLFGTASGPAGVELSTGTEGGHRGRMAQVGMLRREYWGSPRSGQSSGPTCAMIN